MSSKPLSAAEQTEQEKPAGRRLAIVVPTYNEFENIRLHFESVRRALGETSSWEIVYVDDDSPDGTSALLREMAQQYDQVRVIHRIGRRGLSSAVIEGILATTSPFIAVMDCDLQHDEKLLPSMLHELENGALDIVIGSRFVSGGSVGDWDNKRLAMTRLATRFSRIILRENVSDPMSGYFMITRATFNAVVRDLSGRGFKILLDIFASSPVKLRFKEIPFSFGIRKHGDSKVDSTVIIEYADLLIEKFLGGYVPPRFVLFALVGGSGLIVHFAVLYLAINLAGQDFPTAQTASTVAAMTTNFMLNNELTFRERRLRGGRFMIGLLTFYAICFVGVIGNVGIASTLFNRNYGFVLSALAGIAIGTVWNYAVSSAVTWQKK
jgi:dolichol-phosphate mannosyltransferase